jgi:2-polyprenyl-3-methyl-5-hydroxy-6-metoxy-1,4-benzoquinol methylase
MPCYNEAATVKVVVDRVLESPYVRELVIVDDGSTDGTVDILGSLGDPRVRVLLQPINLGKGAALRRGFREASAPFVIVQDADLEYDPADYAQILAPLLEGSADVVFGSRFLGGHQHRVLYYWHSVGNGLLTTLSNMFTNVNLTDMETCYKAFRREVIQSVDLHEDRFGFEPEITAKVARAGWRIYEVGISYSGRTYAEGKKIGWKDGARALYGIIRYSQFGERLVRKPQRLTDADPLQPVQHPQSREALFDSLSDAENYADWILDLIEPHLGHHVLEVGAGQGDLTERLRRRGHRVTVTEADQRSAAALEERFASDPDVEVHHADLVPPDTTEIFDSIVAVNVVEHLPRDDDAIARLAHCVRPGGRLVLVVPAFDSLSSDIDARVGHRRRYRTSELALKLDRSGLRVVEAQYFNVLGALAWWLFARQLGWIPAWSGRLLDEVAIPMTRRFESQRSTRFGQALLCVGKRPAD